jgi:predicted DNA-binding protein with PD1-like motif
VVSAESRRGRRIVGNLDRGTDLLEGLRAVCRKHNVRSGELRAVGNLESAEIAAYDPARRAWGAARAVTGGALELLSLIGNISERDGATVLSAKVTLLRQREGSSEVVGGQLMRARVFSLEFVIEAFDDVILRRGLDPATGLQSWRDALAETAPAANDVIAAARAPVPVPVPAPPPPPATRPDTIVAPPPPPAPRVPPPAANPFDRPLAKPGDKTSWADVMAASAAAASPGPPRPSPPVPPPPPPRREASEPDHEEHEELVAGDIILHPKFGRCEVERIEGGNEFAHVRLRNGRVVRLSLDVLTLRKQGMENGQRVFAAQIS